MTRLLTIMGSGETAPTMVKPHRQLFDRLGPGPVRAVLLDTPYGFQANADDISARAVEYFAASVGRKVEVAELRRAEGADPVRWEAGQAAVASANWVFAGPGSPTYALRQWRESDVPRLLADKLAHGGCVIFASAAALTLGRFTVQVYEVYKSGEDPVWADGLDLLADIDGLGPNVAVIPHYDNAEGGTHDTRFCYLGEPRLAMLETQLPEDGWVLGVDEHTGIVFDLDAGSATIVGNGVVTVRRRGRSAVLPSGETIAIADLGGLADSVGAGGGADGTGATGSGGGGEGAGGRGGAGEAGRSPADKAPTALHGEIRRLEADFDAAIEARNAGDAVRAVLELEDTLTQWAGDTTQSDAGDRGRAALRRMVTRLGELATAGTRDPAEVVGGFVDALLAERSAARGQRRYDDADRVRDELVGLGVEVRDSPDGTTWSLRA
jgi:hypothetical protein